MAARAGFYASGGKRGCDLVASAVALLLLSPLLVVLLLVVRLTSSGPGFYRQERVGRGGRTFRLVKFRSMYPDADQRGLPLTSAGDPRITPVGRILRRTKLDELAQLWNVLVGDMSIVGPRPEVPQYVALYSAAQREVLSVRPGLTDPASIAYRYEEELLRGCADPDRCYREVILPDKLDMSLQYLRDISFWRDLAVVCRTMSSLFSPSHVVPRQSTF